MRTGVAFWIGLFFAAISPAQKPSPQPAAIQSPGPPIEDVAQKPSPTQAAIQSPVPQFEDVAQKAGLTVPHISSPDKRYIVESMSGGVGLIDCDNDGKLDILTVNGSTLDHFRHGGDPLITLYHQDAG